MPALLAVFAESSTLMTSNLGAAVDHDQAVDARSMRGRHAGQSLRLNVSAPSWPLMRTSLPRLVRAHVDRVVVFLGVDRQQPAGTVDVDRVGALRRVDGGLGRVRAVDRERRCRRSRARCSASRGRRSRCRPRARGRVSVVAVSVPALSFVAGAAELSTFRTSSVPGAAVHVEQCVDRIDGARSGVVAGAAGQRPARWLPR